MRTPHRQFPIEPRSARGLTLVEIAVAIAVAALFAALAIPAYTDYVERARVARARADIQDIDAKIAQFELTHPGVLPDDLAEVGAAGLRDPWGNPYYYLNLRNPENLNAARKDRNLHPINTDYDLYSAGRDGMTVKPLTAQQSQDDVIRARNGRFIGLVRDYY
ncbi:MAG: prepilin-type N-terminal cleavage/methylation domain-containing protein [Pseudomonadota bacterium]